MEENQNTNEQEQLQELPVPEVNQTSETIPPATPATSSLKEEPSTPATPSQVENNQPQTESMEVHKHPHHVTHKKKWSEYLLEFFMLFLAVFLGFIAENQREHIVEHNREIKFAGRLLADLRSDSALFQSRIQQFAQRQNDQKHFLEIMSNPTASSDSAVFSSFGLLLHSWNPDFTTATYTQMKTSGSLRYIHNDELTSELQKYYDVHLPRIEKEVQDLRKVFTDYILPYMIKHFRFQDLSDSASQKNIFLNRSPDSDQELINIMGAYSAGWDTVFDLYKSDMEQMLKIIELLKKEYHFK